MSTEQGGPEKSGFLPVFSKWTNLAPAVFFLVIGPVATVLAVFVVWFYFSPWNTDVGYMPEQPLPYSHALHAGELKIDCRYCHTGVERYAKAGIPPTQTCMNCHRAIKTDSPKLALVRESCIKGYEKGDSMTRDCDADGAPVPWVRVHKIADYAYFDHSAHYQAGVGCESCHGRIDQQVEVYQSKPLSMGWCMDCHNNPTPHLRPKEMVTFMGYEEQMAKSSATPYGETVEGKVNPPIHCGGCHR